MYFEKNISALTTHNAIHPHLLKQLSETAPAEDLEFFTTEDDNYTVQYKGVLLHDAVSPIVEARQTVMNHSKPDLDRVQIVFGLGLGYLLDELFKTSKGKIVVYEQDASLLRFVLENVDLSPIFASGRVWLTGTDYQLIYALREKVYKEDQIDVLILRSYAYLLADEISSLMGKVVNLFRDRLQDIKTAQYYHFRWIESVLTNYPYFPGVHFIDDLLDKYEGRTAVIVSSGPSLDDALPALHALKDSVVTVAVGGALRRLHQEGFTPDFAVFYDAIGMKEQLHGLPEEYLGKIPFIMAPVAQNACYTVPSNGKIIFQADNAKQIASWLDSVLDRKSYRMEGGGSVSLVAMQAALAMGCKRIILAGQDLAYTNNKAYAGGVEARQDENGNVVFENTDTLYVEPARTVQVKGQNGGMMLSSVGYEGFIRHFEDIADVLLNSGKGLELYNASIGGAALDGYTLKPLSEFVGQIAAWKTPDAPLWQPNMGDVAIQERKRQLHYGLVDLRSRCEKAIKLYEGMRDGIHADVEPGPKVQTVHRIVEDTVTRFFQQVKSDNFLSYILMFEAINFSKDYQAGGDSDEAKISDAKAVHLMLSNCIVHLQEKLLPWIDQAQSQLHASIAPTESPIPLSA